MDEKYTTHISEKKEKLSEVRFAYLRESIRICKENIETILECLGFFGRDAMKKEGIVVFAGHSEGEEVIAKFWSILSG